MYDTRYDSKNHTWTFRYKVGTGSWKYYFGTGHDYIGNVYSWRGPRKEKDKYGWESPNDFDLNRFSCQYDDFNWSVRHPSGAVQVCEGPWMAAVSASSPTGFSGLFQELPIDQSEASAFVDQAALSAWSEANAPAKCPGLTWLFEGQETAEMLKDVVGNMLSITKAAWKRELTEKALAAYKKADKDAKALADIVTDIWLQWRYGIQPLMLQVMDILELYRNAQKELETITGYVNRQDTLDEMDISYKGAGHDFKFKYYKKKKIVGAVKLYPAALREEVDEFPWGTGPHDYLLALWEKTWLSFVADWFLTIGDFLAAYRPGCAEIAHQSSTRVIEVTEELIPNGYEVYDSGYTLIQMAPPAVWKATSLVIYRDTDIYRPTLPTFTNESLSLIHKLDGISLLFKIGSSLLQRKGR